jgi:hypothetical protein
VVLGLELRVYTFSHSTSPICVRYFWHRVSWSICPGWLWTEVFLISASWIARITGLSHLCLAYTSPLMRKCRTRSPGHC